MSKQVYTLVDFQNAVEQIATPETEKCPLLPLFEAIHNSIQSIKQAKICNGYVNVKITRDPDDIPAKCISEISIEDNGVGFTEENLLSFGRLFSTYKKNEFNCKGIGRLSYFAVFNDIVIDSEFEKNGKFYKILRRINKNNFYKISKIKLCETNMKFANRTFITLKNVNPNFKNKLKIPEDAVQNQITQHFIPSLLSIKNFKITVLDESGSYDVDHNASDVSQGNSININSNIFDLYFLKNRSSVRSKHKIILSADGRTVKEEKIEFLPTSKIGLDDDKFYLNAVVISDFLDSKLNSQRTDFRIPTKKELGNNEISLDEIYEKVFEESRRFASESITHLENVLNDFIEKTCEELPHLSFLKNDKKIRENFKLGVDAETVKNTYVHQFAVKQVESFNYVRAISKKYESKDIPNFDDFKKEAIEKLEDGMKINHAPLITYITYRDFVLSLYV